MKDSLFNFMLSPKPNPLETDTLGIITLNARPKTGNIYWEKIVIQISVGDQTEALCRRKEDITAETGQWRPTDTEFELRPEYWHQTFYNDQKETPVTTAFTIAKITAHPVTDIDGEAKIIITEYSSLQPSGPFERRDSVSLTVKKVAETFLLAFFIARNTEQKPSAEFGKGEAIELLWKGSKGNNYKLYQGNSLIYSGTDTSYPSLTGTKLTLARSTTFILEAQRDSDCTYNSLNITVSNPEPPTVNNRKQVGLDRGVLLFSNFEKDWNHTIYNNYSNIDQEGPWDGLKMNVYEGLEIRTGDANTNPPKVIASLKKDGLAIHGILKADTVQTSIIRDVVKVSDSEVKVKLSQPVERGILRIYGSAKGQSGTGQFYLRLNHSVDKYIYYTHSIMSGLYEKKEKYNTYDGLFLACPFGENTMFQYSLLIQNSLKFGQGLGMNVVQPDLLTHINFGFCNIPEPIDEIILNATYLDKHSQFSINAKDLQVIYEPFYS